MIRAMNELTHFNSAGECHMVDVGDKSATYRQATAEGRIQMLPSTLALIAQGTANKGDVLGIARVAAIQATKRTSDLIPLCHPIGLTHVSTDFVLDHDSHSITLRVTTKTTGQTGVEMEALTGVSVGLLTIYDMCKAVDRGMTIGSICLVEKSGGKSGHWLRD